MLLRGCYDANLRQYGGCAKGSCLERSTKHIVISETLSATSRTDGPRIQQSSSTGATLSETPIL